MQLLPPLMQDVLHMGAGPFFSTQAHALLPRNASGARSGEVTLGNWQARATDRRSGNLQREIFDCAAAANVLRAPISSVDTVRRAVAGRGASQHTR